MSEASRERPGEERLRVIASLALERETSASAWVEVTGGSMRPLIQAGDSLYVEFESRPVRIGEIAVFTQDGRVIVHRLVGHVRRRGAKLLLTRGDGLAFFDAPVPPERVFGIAKFCRRAADGAIVPILPGGPGGLALALVSRLGAVLVETVGRMPAHGGRRLDRLARRISGSSVFRLAGLLAAVVPAPRFPG